MNLSFEFFPPKNTQSKQTLQLVRQELSALNPEYFSVTFGAGGSTQTSTLETILDIQTNDNTAATPHISCVGSTKDELLNLLQIYQKNNIKRLVVLRGDIPSGMVGSGEFNYAYELVEFIRQHFNNTFIIKVAAYPEKHPQSPNAHQDMIHFVDKIKAGANSAITQYFYNIDAYLYFVDSVQKQGIDVPIVPGIMPITNYIQLARFSYFSGAQIPQWILNQLEIYQHDKASLIDFGYEVVAKLCAQLKSQGVNDFHFYSMNRTHPSKKLAEQLLK